MCTSIIEIATACGMAKRGDDWFPLTHSVVAYDHARHAHEGDVITLDFINTGLEPGARDAALHAVVHGHEPALVLECVLVGVLRVVRAALVPGDDGVGGAAGGFADRSAAGGKGEGDDGGRERGGDAMVHDDERISDVERAEISGDPRGTGRCPWRRAPR